jgi:hypothetical protein
MDVLPHTQPKAWDQQTQKSLEKIGTAQNAGKSLF